MRILFCVLASFLVLGAQAQVWSPDGKKIAFFYIHSIEDIYTVDTDGGAFKVLEGHPERDFAPQWSPDGRHILFTSMRDGHHEIYRFNFRGKQLKKLTDTEFDSMDGHYSPDGKSIVFASNRTGNNELFIMDIDGENVRQLTFSPETENTPRWSPDGSRILFLKATDSESQSDIYTISPAGTDLKQLTKTPELGEFHPSWSADGAMISFVQVSNGAFQIATMKANGEGKKILVNKKGYQAFYPHWSPDGQYITFTRDVMEGTKAGFPALFSISLSGEEMMLTDKNSF